VFVVFPYGTQSWWLYLFEVLQVLLLPKQNEKNSRAPTGSTNELRMWGLFGSTSDVDMAITLAVKKSHKITSSLSHHAAFQF
jgi:hypothetical protein